MAIVKTIELEAKVDKAEKDLKGVSQTIQKIDTNLEDVKDSSSGVAKGVKGIGNAIKAAGIGLAIAAFAKLAEVFNQNQKVADTFNTAFEALSLAFNDFFNFLDRNIGTVIDYFKGIFSDPQQALVDFGNAIKANLIERFNSFLDTLGFLASAVKKVFSGDFAGALEDVKSAGKETVDIFTGVDNSVDKIAETTSKVAKGIVEYTKSTIAAAKANVDLQKSAEVAEVQNQILIEQYDRQAEKLRQIRDDDTRNIEERIKANNDLAAVLDEQEKLMLANADLIIATAQAQYNKNQNQENYIALLQAQAEREGVLAQIEGFRSEQISNRISLEKEQADLKKEADEAEIDRIKEKAELEAKLAEERKQQIYETLDATIDAAGQETQVGRGLFMLKQGLRIKEQIAEAKATLQKITLRAAEAQVDTASGAASTAKVGFPQNIPLLIAFAAQAAGIISSVKSAVNAAKGATGGIGGGGGGASAPSAPQAPSFNVVGAAPENQLAQTIGNQEQKPLKAFVVSSEVSSQQALDRNIENGAAIG